jgi:hypothetical protein
MRTPIFLLLALAPACTTPIADTYKILPAHCAGSGRIVEGTELYAAGQLTDTVYEDVGKCDSWALCINDPAGAYCDQ